MAAPMCSRASSPCAAPLRILGVARHEVVTMSVGVGRGSTAPLSVRRVGPLPWEQWDGDRWVPVGAPGLFDEALVAFEREVGACE